MIYTVDATWTAKEGFRQFLTLIYNYYEELEKSISCVLTAQDIPFFPLISFLLLAYSGYVFYYVIEVISDFLLIDGQYLP